MKIRGILLLLLFAALTGCEIGMTDYYNDLTRQARFFVKYNANEADGGNVPEDDTEYREGYTVTVKGDTGGIKKEGYLYAGWNTKADGTGATYTQGQMFTIGKSDVILYVLWSNKPVYRITYDANGADSGNTPVDNTNYEKNSPVKIPGNPGGLVKAGYTFIGWNTRSNGTGINYTEGGQDYIMGESDVTLFANWSSVPTYRVIYNSINPELSGGDLGGEVPEDTTSRPAGSEVVIFGNDKNLVHNHYTLTRWNSKNDGSGTFYDFNEKITMPAADLQLYPVWAPKEFSVKFFANGGAASMLSQPITYGQTAALNANTFTRTGYTFAGWATYPGGNAVYTDKENYKMITAGADLYAKWTANTYTVIFNFQGGTGSPSSKDVTYDLPYGDLPVTTSTGWTFNGWYTQSSEGNRIYSTTTVTTAAPHTLYAAWTVNSYNVVFLSNGGTGTMSSQPITFGVAANLDPNTFTRTGYTFAGWATSPGDSVLYVDRGIYYMSTEGGTLHAIWTANKYNVVFNSNGGTGNLSAQEITFGQTVPLKANNNTITRTGYNFDGWALTSEGGVSYPDQTNYFMNTEGAVLYAKWSAKTCNVVFNSNGGTGTMASQSIAYDGTAQLNSNTFTLSNNVFVGWATSSDGNVEYNNQANLTMNTEGKTLFAKWDSFKPRSWISVTSSSDGTKLAAVVYGGYIYTSTDSGANWTARATEANRNWLSITSSSGGTKLAAVVNPGNIYTSTDSGATWTARATDANRNWYSIASSSDGTKLAAVHYGGYIYTSTDSGVSWTLRGSSRNWSSITSSAGGENLAAVVNGGYIYTSTDSGESWTASATDDNRNWFKIASCTNGTNLAAVVRDGYIYTSTNSGADWTERTASGERNWWSIASSDDGTKLAAVSEKKDSPAPASVGYIYTSTDSGANWTASADGESRAWRSIASSADGQKLVAVIGTGGIYTSTDYGVNWTRRY